MNLCGVTPKIDLNLHSIRWIYMRVRSLIFRVLAELEKARILITLKMKYSSNLVSQLIDIEGVSEAALIYGPYARAIVETDTKENLSNTVVQIRQLLGVQNTLTINVIP